VRISSWKHLYAGTNTVLYDIARRGGGGEARIARAAIRGTGRPDAALAIKRDEFDGELEDVIAAEDVFEDASSGDRPPEDSLEEVFETTDPSRSFPR